VCVCVRVSNLQFFLQFTVCRSTKLQFFSRAVFQPATINDFGEDDVAHFNSLMEIVSEGLLPDFDAVINHFRQRGEPFTRRESGYVLERVRQLCFVKLRPFGISVGSFVPTPLWIKKHGGGR